MPAVLPIPSPSSPAFNDNSGSAKDGNCDGVGCCHVDIPAGLTDNKMRFTSDDDWSHANQEFCPCDYAFIVEKGNYTFRAADLRMDVDRTGMPLLLDWAIRGGNGSSPFCDEAPSISGYACLSDNSECIDSKNGPGYVCSCTKGYQGSPYLDKGCTSLHSAGHRTIVVVTILCLLVAVLTLVGFLLWLWRRRKAKVVQEQQQQLAGMQESQEPRTQVAQEQQRHLTGLQESQEPRTQVSVARAFTYAELMHGTNNFAEKNVLGKGSFAVVYERKISGMQEHVAIKRIIHGKMPLDKTIKDFQNEITIMSRLDHRNILHLVGWCEEGDDFMLVYEIMNNGNLHDHLYPVVSASDRVIHRGPGPEPRLQNILTWPRRRHILIGITSGLNYLHLEGNKVTMHRDIKPANVMLDKEFNAKLVDFGLVTQVNHTETSRYTVVVYGSEHYIDPEYVLTRKASRESDVYSLGVLLLEMVCGQKPKRLHDGQNSLIMKVEQARDASNILEAADSRLRGEFDKEMKSVLELGLMCVHENRHRRPNMGVIKQSLMRFQQASSLPPGDNENGDELGANEDAGVAPFARRWASMPL